MIDGKSASVDDLASAARAQEQHDFSILHGFQLVAPRAASGGDGDQRDEAWSDALKLELEARAARFHQAVDASIVLANDGAVRWLGDPVAKLALGTDLLTPRAVILADDALPEEAREKVAARLELWLAATMRRLLGPLFELQALQDASGDVRDLAGKIVRSLGVLDRDPIRGQVRALDQNARAGLRKRGVRFGAYYIYIPTSLKPAARVLALHLSNLQTPALGADEFARALAPLASSGRTSLPCDPLISRENYRVAGFRRCGDRIVRIDIVERLADMIRAATIERSGGGDEENRARGVSGFLVNGQMTSLTGCSGDQFASILKSLGFECEEIKRSEVAGESTPARDLAASNKDTGGRASPEEDSSSPPGEEALDQRPELGQREITAGEEAATPVQDLTAGDAGANNAGADDGGSDESGTTPDAPMLQEAASSEEKATVHEETVVFWRRSPRIRHPNRRERRLGQSRGGPDMRESRAPTAEGRRDYENSASPARGRGGSAAEPPGEAPAAFKGENRDRGLSEPSVVAGGSHRKHADKKRRQTPGNRDISPGRPNSGLQQGSTVDPNSPFAKLIELRSLLEAQSKNRP